MHSYASLLSHAIFHFYSESFLDLLGIILSFSGEEPDFSYLVFALYIYFLPVGVLFNMYLLMFIIFVFLKILL